MENTYIVEGAGWFAQVEIDSPELFLDVATEVATRAVESLFNKRDDTLITKMKDDADITELLNLSNEEKIESNNTVNSTETAWLEGYMDEMLYDEISPNCGIGGFLKIRNNTDTWYVSSEKILENVGLQHLVWDYRKKFPTRQTHGKPMKKSRKAKNKD